MCYAVRFSADGITLQDMLTELKDVTTKWFKLGVFLGVPSEVLKGITHNVKMEKNRKLQMLIEWSKQDKPTWEKLVTALINADLPTVAVRIATNHRKSSKTHYLSH
jgi:hypothetical protein